MRFAAIVLALVSITVSCTKEELNENSICFTRTATQLKIENNTNKVLYIASFGQNILPVIYWVPTCGNNNNVQPNTSINMDLSTISGVSDDEKLVVYWWECSDGNFQQLHNVILDRDQTVCG